MNRPVPPIPDSPLYHAAEALSAAAHTLSGESLILKAHLRFGNAASARDTLVKVAGTLSAIEAATPTLRAALVEHGKEQAT